MALAKMSTARTNRLAFTPSRPVPVRAAVRVQRSRAAGLTVRAALLREKLDPEFVEQVKSEFPEKMLASPDEALVLFTELGYTYVDVRPSLECEEVGKLKLAVNIPFMNAKRVYSAEENRKVVVKEPNPNFLSLFQKKFPKKDTPLLIACSDFKSYSIDALETLDEAGYTNLCSLRGGYYSFFRVFDNNLRRRRTGEYAETYTHDGDSCGIHASGAGFDRVDKIERWVPPKY